MVARHHMQSALGILYRKETVKPETQTGDFLPGVCVHTVVIKYSTCQHSIPTQQVGTTFPHQRGLQGRRNAGVWRTAGPSGNSWTEKTGWVSKLLDHGVARTNLVVRLKVIKGTLELVFRWKFTLKSVSNLLTRPPHLLSDIVVWNGEQDLNWFVLFVSKKATFNCSLFSPLVISHWFSKMACTIPNYDV